LSSLHYLSLIISHFYLGLPCLPLAGQLLKPTVKVEVHELPGTVTVDFRSVAFLSTVSTVCVIAFLVSLISNHRLRRRIVDLTSSDESNRWQRGTISEDHDSTNAVHEYTKVEEELLAPFVSWEKELTELSQNHRK
jgi:hypothetical protein